MLLSFSYFKAFHTPHWRESRKKPTHLTAILSLFVLDDSDPELARAQFESFVKQMPLLYLILVLNAVAISVEFFRSNQIWLTVAVPLVICGIALVRGWWWWCQDGSSRFSDADITRTNRRTCNIALVMTLAFDAWAMAIYPSGDIYARAHLSFFLALTQVSMVFCLMTMRAAAMRVAVTSTTCFVLYFGLIDNGHMLIEALAVGFVGLGMMVVTDRYNHDFSQLVVSRRDLRTRQEETEKLSEENRRIALTDSLSGLPNRRELLVRLDRLEGIAGDRTDSLAPDSLAPDSLAPDSLAMVFIDLDGFKQINDAHGHQAGDTLIRSLSERLRVICEGRATLARVGGDEFAVLVECHGATVQATALAHELNDEICLPVLVDRHVLQVGASIGIASNADEVLHAHELLRRADTAMYHVKTGGKGDIAVYDVAFDLGRMWRLTIENEIGLGLANDEFEVAYQPVVDAASGAIVAAEALIRWPRRPGGPLDPDQFIQIAEATGQIHPMGLFVLDRACRDLGPLAGVKLSVNVSPAQFRDPKFVRQVAHVLEQTRFPPGRLQLEITEGYLLAHPDGAIQAISGFKAMGMSVALDDFGTGFTSIHYLQSYGFSHIKLDKSLLVGLHQGSKASLLITGAIYLASGLDMRVIAEGVETEEQARLLRAAGCHKLQGYLFGRPMPIEAFALAFEASGAASGNASSGWSGQAPQLLVVGR